MDLVANIGYNTGFAFTPDGRLLMALQPGLIFVYRGGQVLGIALNLNPGVCSGAERGLLGLAVDPHFESNHFVYVYYTHGEGGTCSTSSPSVVNRVSRFILDDSNVIDPATEWVLIDKIPSWSGRHNGGDLHFGMDGYLYVSVGDGACDYAEDSGCDAENDAARDPNVLLGKILRVTRHGDIPPTNPWQGPGTAPCALTGGADEGVHCQETFATGLRNPFRMAFDPNAEETRFFINDVGEHSREEINLGEAGADYGWHCREGLLVNDSSGKCAGLPPATFRDPIYQYSHGRCRAITGAAFVPDGLWPAEYDGSYLYADFACGEIFRLAPDGGGGYTAHGFVTGFYENRLRVMTFGPDGLYVGDGGQVFRIRTTENELPTASLLADSTDGPLPLLVTFDATGSSDADGTVVEYYWDLGDGSPQRVTKEPSMTHLYGSAETFRARLRVRDDSFGLSAPATVVIEPVGGNALPVPSIDAPAPGGRFRPSDTIQLEGRAVDPEDGELESAALTWTVIFHHGDEDRVLWTGLEGSSHVVTAPALDDVGAAGSSSLEIQLTAVDSEGASRTLSRQLLPHRVSLLFETEPAGLTVSLDGHPVTGPSAVLSWEGYPLSVGAPPQLDSEGAGWEWESWSDGGASTHTVPTPTAPARYLATFSPFPVLSVGDIRAREYDEGTPKARFSLSLSAPSSESVSVDYATADLTAQAGVDYTAAAGRLSFSPGQVLAYLDVDLTPDRTAERNKTFRLDLAAPSSSVLARPAATATIVNDDPAHDWNGDGTGDLVWHNQETGVVAIWLMQGASAIGSAVVGSVHPVYWRLAGTGDFDGDGGPDLVFHNRSSGHVAVWLMTGTTFREAIEISGAGGLPHISIVGVEDFDGDGLPDLIAYDIYFGETSVQYVEDERVRGSDVFDYRGGGVHNWRLAGVGDFDDDGKPDAVWRSTWDEIGVIYMDGLAGVRGELLGPGQVPPHWRVQAVTDLDGDGRPEVVWREDDTGVLALWRLVGSQLQEVELLQPDRVPPEWEVVAPR